MFVRGFWKKTGFFNFSFKDGCLKGLVESCGFVMWANNLKSGLEAMVTAERLSVATKNLRLVQ